MCASHSYKEHPDITGTFDQRQAACLKKYPEGPGLAVVLSSDDMKRAREACSGQCLLGVRWVGDKWKWVDGRGLGRYGRLRGAYNNWEDATEDEMEQPVRSLIKDGNTYRRKETPDYTTAGFGEWGDNKMIWRNLGDLSSPYGTTLCARCESAEALGPTACTRIVYAIAACNHLL